jgi:antitoxin component YwqK of YwqJK toxin-antitoxin module
MKLRKIISALLCLSFIVAALSVFGVVGFAESESIGDTAEPADRLGVGEGASALDGKKIIFIGCSYTYYGGIVERSASNKYNQAERSGSAETGLFSRFCKQNGVKDLYVTDWVFGGHDLTDLFDGYCNAGDHDGHDHLADLVDRDYDIVVIHDILTPGFESPEEYVESLATAVNVFREVNPDTKFYMMQHNQVYLQNNYQPIRDSIQLAVKELGVGVIDWGALVYDLIKDNVTVPGGTAEYNKNSFIVSNSASDGYHPNLLAGYIGTMMIYATLTGETTVGQPYEWIYPLTSKYLNIDKFIASYYKYDDPSTDFDERSTNMKDIFYSDSEMLGLQKLAEEYLSKERWLDFAEYTVEFRDGDEVICSKTYKWGETVEIPEAPLKDADDRYVYEFVGWDKSVDAECSGNAVYTAFYENAARKYTVTFLDNDGTVLSSGEYAWGDAVTAPTVVTKEDAEYKYTFKAWDKTVTECQGDAVYTATYIRTGHGYIISFRDFDGTLISAESYKVGDVVTPPASPERAADNTYTYVFAGWDKEILPCSGDAEYVAVYTATYIDYTVKFLDENGNIISEEIYHWGDEVAIPDAPVKPSDDRKTYTFLGWGAEVVPCAGDATYQASFSEEWIIYSVVFFDDEGEVIVTRNYKWGEKVTPPTAPKKLSDDEYDYVFAGWDKTVIDCRGSASYTALYTAIPKAGADDTPDEPEIPDAPITPDDGVGQTPDEGEDSFFDMIVKFFESIINWFKSLFGIK